MILIFFSSLLFATMPIPFLSDFLSQDIDLGLNYEERPSLQLDIDRFLKSKKETCIFPQDHPLCRLIPQKKQRKAALPQKITDATRNAYFAHNTALFCKGDNKTIQSLLLKEKSLLRLEQLAEDLWSGIECPSIQIAFYLGKKLEEHFPEKRFIDMCKNLYSDATRLADPNEPTVILIHYRLALIHLWQKNYLAAWNIFRLYEDFKTDDSTLLRMAFWKNFCAQKLGLKKEAEKTAEQIRENYPFSIYAYLLKKPLFYSKDYPIFYRLSDDQSQWNNIIRYSEILIKKNQFSLAEKLLSFFSQQKEFEQLDMRFQLYWAILLKKAKANIPYFWLLIRIIRHFPELKKSQFFLKLLYPQDYFDLLPKTDPYFVLSVMRQESAFNPQAKSTAKAMGLMQIQIATARHLGFQFSSQKLFSPETNIQLGSKYLTQLMSQFQNQIELSLAAYNAGPTRIKSFKERYPCDNPLLFSDLLPIKETREYISSILRNYFFYQTLYPNQMPSPAFDNFMERFALRN